MLAIRITHLNCKPVENKHQYETVSITDTYGATVKHLLEFRGDFILIEHDNDPTPADLRMMWAFKYAFGDPVVVAARYWLYKATTGLDEIVCAHRPDLGYWLEDAGIQKIKYFGLGCTYLPKEAAPLINPTWDYPAFDYLLSQAWLDAGYEAYALPIWVEHHHKE